MPWFPETSHCETCGSRIDDGGACTECRVGSIKVGSSVIWTAQAKANAGWNLRVRLKDKGPGIVTKIHHWSDGRPTIRIEFPGRYDIASVDDVELVQEV